eukprot:458098_1
MFFGHDKEEADSSDEIENVLSDNPNNNHIISNFQCQKNLNRAIILSSAQNNVDTDSDSDVILLNNDDNSNSNQYVICNKPNQQIELRPYQIEAIELLLNRNKSRMQCIMACGTGKTFVMLHYLFKIIYDKSQSNQYILFLLPSLQLINQIYQSFVNYFGATQKTLCLCSQMDRVALTQNEVDEQIDEQNANEILDEFLKEFLKVPYTTNPDEI